MTALVDVLVYAAALDLYTRFNRRQAGQLTDRERSSMLRLCDWYARPALLGVGQ